MFPVKKIISKFKIEDLAHRSGEEGTTRQRYLDTRALGHEGVPWPVCTTNAYLRVFFLGWLTYRDACPPKRPFVAVTFPEYRFRLKHAKNSHSIHFSLPINPQFFSNLAKIGICLVLCLASARADDGPSDTDILNFALNLGG